MLTQIPRFIARGLRKALRRNEFGLRGLIVPYLWMLRRSNPRELRLRGHSIRISDPFWVVNDFEEIFWREIYHFPTSAKTPLILDCGANVGLSVIYFKLLYPQSRVIAFEPDEQIYALLHRNVAEFALENVELVNKAVWKEDATLEFAADGGVGGRVVTGHPSSVKVPAIRLRPFLEHPVDLLKLDIEGAETVVLEDCRDLLKNVSKLFIEFHGDSHSPQNLQRVLTILNEAGFRYYIKEAVDEPRPLDYQWRWKRFDVQLNIFAGRD